MHLHLMSILLHLSLVPFKALLELADEGVVPPVGILFLLPLHGLILGLVLFHLAREEASPPDVKLVLTQLTLQAPLLGVGTANVVLDISLPCTGPGAALPGAGVADVGVGSLHMNLPHTRMPKTLPTMFTLESSDLLMHILNVLVKIPVRTELQATFVALVVLLLPMNRLLMIRHGRLMAKPHPTLWTLVVYSIMDRLLVTKQATATSKTLVASLHATLECLNLCMSGTVGSQSPLSS